MFFFETYESIINYYKVLLIIIKDMMLLKLPHTMESFVETMQNMEWNAKQLLDT